MKTLSKISLVFFLIFLINSCKKDDPVPPTLSTTSISEITTTTAVSGGNVTNDGGAPVISRGICWNTSNNPEISNNKTVESGESGSFTSNITLLDPNTTYYVRAYATNSAGTSYGSSVSFKTLGDKPASNSQNASNIELTAATLNGTVNPNSLETTVTFEYGLTTSYGSTDVAQQSPLSGDSDGNVSADLTGLSFGTTYHFRIKAENTLGITYSSDMTFTTLGQVPTVETFAASNIQLNSFTFNGSINPNYLPTIITCEYGTTTNYGNSFNVLQNPFTGNTDLNFSGDIEGLSEGTTYYFRIKATNDLGTTYGDEQSFITNLADYEGNIYHPINIGTQMWLVENLKVTHYRDGSSIDNIDSNTPWNSIATGAFCYYDDDINNSTEYGNLYNWYATVDARGLCPTGWHVPTNSEWETLETYLGGIEVAGGKMKEAGSTHWTGLNTGADNSSGFTALPGGRRFDSGIPAYGNIGSDGFWWSSSEFDLSNSWSIDIYTTSAMLYRTNMYIKTWGFSIRCLKDSK